MASWGVGIFQNDAADDVKYDYRCKLRLGKSDEEALNEILEENKHIIDDEDEMFDFWFGLAKVLWDYGRLCEEVKEKALELIKSGEDLKRWETETEKRKRKIALDKLTETLCSEMPERKKVSLWKAYISPWKKGDVFLYKFCSDEAKKIGIYDWYLLLCIDSIEDVCMEIDDHYHKMPMMYYKIFKERPCTEEDIIKAEFIPFGPLNSNGKREYKRLMITKHSRNIPKTLEYWGNINNMPIPMDLEEPRVEPITIWKLLERGAIEYYKKFVLSN